MSAHSVAVMNSMPPCHEAFWLCFGSTWYLLFTFGSYLSYDTIVITLPAQPMHHCISVAAMYSTAPRIRCMLHGLLVPGHAVL